MGYSHDSVLSLIYLLWLGYISNSTLIQDFCNTNHFPIKVYSKFYWSSKGILHFIQFQHVILSVRSQKIYNFTVPSRGHVISFSHRSVFSEASEMYPPIISAWGIEPADWYLILKLELGPVSTTKAVFLWQIAIYPNSTTIGFKFQ